MQRRDRHPAVRFARVRRRKLSVLRAWRVIRASWKIWTLADIHAVLTNQELAQVVTWLRRSERRQKSETTMADKIISLYVDARSCAIHLHTTNTSMRRTTSNGEGGWALWRPQGTWRKGRWPPGRCPFWDQWWSRDLGQPWRIKGLLWPWWLAPPKIFLGGSTFRGHLGSADSRGHSGSDSASSWYGVGSVSSWTGAGSGVDSVSSWTGAGSGVDSVRSWTGAGSGVDSVSSWTGAGSGVDFWGCAREALTLGGAREVLN